MSITVDDLFDEKELPAQEPGQGGGMDLSTGGPRVRQLAGMYTSTWAYRLWVPKNGGELNRSLVPGTAKVQEFDSGAFLYFLPDNISDATIAKAAFAIKQQPSKVFRLEVDLANDVIGWHSTEKTAVEAFGRDVMDYTIQHNAFGVDQYAIGLHLLFMPSMVQAYLRAAHVIEQDIFDYGQVGAIKLPTPRWQEIFVDGYVDEKSGAKVEGSLVTARKAIWLAAGEEDWTKWSNSGDDKVTAPRLIKALGLFHTVSMKNLALAVGNVPIPHVSQIKNNKANLAPVIYRWWRSRAEAEAELALEAEAAVAAREVPANWEGTTRAEFITYLKKFLDEHAPKMGKTKPEVFFTWLRGEAGVKALNDEMGITPDQTMEYLKDTGWPYTK